jgi:hypothetical protein
MSWSSGSSIEPSSKFSAGEGEGIRNMEEADAALVLGDWSICKTNGYPASAHSPILHALHDRTYFADIELN